MALCLAAKTDHLPARVAVMVILAALVVVPITDLPWHTVLGVVAGAPIGVLVAAMIMITMIELQVAAHLIAIGRRGDLATGPTPAYVAISAASAVIMMSIVMQMRGGPAEIALQLTVITTAISPVIWPMLTRRS